MYGGRDEGGGQNSLCHSLFTRAREEARSESIDSGAEDYLAKPFSARSYLLGFTAANGRLWAWVVPLERADSPDVRQVSDFPCVVQTAEDRRAGVLRNAQRAPAARDAPRDEELVQQAVLQGEQPVQWAWPPTAVVRALPNDSGQVLVEAQIQPVWPRTQEPADFRGAFDWGEHRAEMPRERSPA